MSSGYKKYLQSVRAAWLQRPRGQAYLGALGSEFDDNLDLLKQATKARFPTVAPTDALAEIGDERQFDRGPHESDEQYGKRLRAAWIYWPLAGSPLGLLVALHFAEFDGAVLVQQNGLAYELMLPLEVGVDPTPNLKITELSKLSADLTPVAPATKIIPAGTSWWTFDNNTDFCSRFAILFPGPLPGPFHNFVQVTFDGTEDGTVDHPWPLAVWPYQFADANYRVMVGPATVVSGPVPLYVDSDGSAQINTSIPIRATAPFIGTVDVIAYEGNTNPFCSLNLNDRRRLCSVIDRWKPAKATCMGVHALLAGRFWGWPVQKWGAGGKWGSPNTVEHFGCCDLSAPAPWPDVVVIPEI